VQHYSDPNAYNENDLRVLEFVSSEVAQAIDLTRAQEALQRERDFALQVMNALGQGLSVTGPDRRFEFINPAYARLLGYEPEDLIGQKPEKVTWPDDLPLMEKHRQRRRAGETTTYEVCLRHAEGYPIPVLVTGTPRWQGDQVVGAITVITDRHIGPVMEMVGRRRSEFVRMDYLEAGGGQSPSAGQQRVQLVYNIPLSEILAEFHDQLKSITQGYGSFDYELLDYRATDLVNKLGEQIRRQRFPNLRSRQQAKGFGQ